MQAILGFATYLVMEATHRSIFRLVDLEKLAWIWTTGRLDLAVCLPLLAFGRRVP